MTSRCEALNVKFAEVQVILLSFAYESRHE